MCYNAILIQYKRIFIPKTQKQNKKYFSKKINFFFLIDIQSLTASPSRVYAFKSIFDVCLALLQKNIFKKVWRLKKRCYT